ncbi:hypothetical protein [Dehalobacter sp. TeCB1]|uniref:hypothetical protein n=1 Tax=Dehalobacter sp. TeCB1 TaxID=1843715 RepID=UPI00083B3131|nr:hypothetical protein [Dehalobacter sp. TeCB1]OCZ49462.1 hypothetical protein A7D23_03125 [Dehalobacter sp. TeCB1]
MKKYIKPQFEYVALLSEERFAVASSGCTLFGTCPVDCTTVTGTDAAGHSYVFPINYNDPY